MPIDATGPGAPAPADAGTSGSAAGGPVGPVISLSWFYLCSQRGRLVAHWLLMRLPAPGMIHHIVLLGRCLRTMGTVVESGASTFDSVAITRSVVANHYFKQLWDRVNGRLHRGDQLGAPCGATR